MKLHRLLEYEVTEPIIANSYKEVERKCPEGFRVPELIELTKISISSNLLSDYEQGYYRFFWTTPAPEGHHQGLMRGDGEFWVDRFTDEHKDSMGNRVVYVRSLK